MKKLSFLFALLCASVMGFAYTTEPDTWIGTTDATYANQFKWSVLDGVATPNDVVNIQKPGFASEIGIYMNFADAAFDGVYMNGTLTTNGTEYKQDGAGIVVYLSALTAKNTEVLIKQGSTTRFGLNIYNDKGSDGGSGGGGDPDPDPDPAPAGINWGEISWLTNASGVAAYTEKYKAYAGDPGPSNIDVIQNPGWATAPGLYMTFPNADFRNFSLPASNYDVQGAGVIFHMNAFTAKETKVHVNVGGTVRSFTIYYEDGAEGPAEIYDINFALADNGSSATASTGTAGNAIDGNEGTRWESAATDDETFTLDMGQKRIFNTIKIKWEGAYCKEYDLTYSNDGEAWSPLYTETNLTQAGWQTIELGSNVTAQYIKYHGTKRATGWGQSFFEFQVLLPGVSVLTSIDLTSPATIAQIGGAGVALTATPKDQNGNVMSETVSYEITPAAAGHMSGNTYIPDQAVAASIRAYSGEVFSSAVNIIGVPSANLALSTNIDTDNKIIAQSDYTPNGTNAFFAVDGNMGSVWQGSPTNGNVDDSREYDCWFVVDLGAFYDISLVSLHFEGACSELYHIDFSENNVDWNLGYNLVGAEGINARNDYWTDLDNNNKVRYVRFWSTKAATGWGMKMFEFEVYGTEWASGDEEKPVMVSASLVSSTTTSAVIAVSATDNDEVARYRVVDGTNGIDANYTPSEGKITITGLTHNTAYNFTITAKDASNNESENSKVVAVTTPFDETINLALNKECEGGYYDNNPAESADKANDGADNTSWVTYGAHAATLDWWVVDLGNVYTLTNITALWANDAYATAYMLQARVQEPTAADKADDAAWVTLATVSGVTAGEERSTDVSGVGRYVRFRATAHTGFFRLREFRVYGSGVAEVDAEAPVMTSASLVSNTDVQAIIAVAATDNQGVANYHVVDAGNSFNANFVAEAGNITVTGLTGGMVYNLVITAIDFFGNESENSKSVAVTTTAHYTEPQTAAPVPTWPADQVKSLYSNTYTFAPASLNSYNEGWWAAPVMTEGNVDGNTYLHYNLAADGMIGWQFAEISVALMEKLHIDIFSSGSGTLTIRPITTGGPEIRKTLTLVGQQWNSFDVALTEFPGHDWTKLFQFSIEYWNAGGLTGEHISVDNVYFYRETAYVDGDAPTNASASVATEGFYSVKITAQAEDNSSSVNFKVMNGEAILATGAAASGEATTISVSDLTPGTAYNLNVVAYDEAGNEAAAVAVAAITKALPAPIVPDWDRGDVIPVYTDAMPGGVNFHTGGWGEATVAQRVQIADDDEVFYMQNLNWAGWHSWGADIDATDMDYIHVDFYSTGMTQVSFTPISHDPTSEGVYNIVLTPNAWTSAEIPLSAYANNGIEWNKIFQFKFMNPVGGDELMVDNVFFYRSTPYEIGENADNATTIATLAARNRGMKVKVNRSFAADKGHYTLVLPFDVDADQVANVLKGTVTELRESYQKENGDLKLNFVDVTSMQAGKAYLYQPAEAVSNPVFSNVVVEEGLDDSHTNYAEFIGIYAPKNVSTLPDDAYVLGADNYLYEASQIDATNDNTMLALRAYFTLDFPAQFVQGRRTRAMVVFNEPRTDMPTDVEEVEEIVAPAKRIENGQLIIEKNGRLYNAQGQVIR